MFRCHVKSWPCYVMVCDHVPHIHTHSHTGHSMSTGDLSHPNTVHHGSRATDGRKYVAKIVIPGYMQYH